MQFDSFAEFLTMGGHGLYVWLTYGISAVIIIFNIVQPVIRRRNLIKQHAQRLRRERRGQERDDEAQA